LVLDLLTFSHLSGISAMENKKRVRNGQRRFHLTKGGVLTIWSEFWSATEQTRTVTESFHGRLLYNMH
jgi:hypothetical protein